MLLGFRYNPKSRGLGKAYDRGGVPLTRAAVEDKDGSRKDFGAEGSRV